MPRKRVEIEVTPLSQTGSTVNCNVDPPSDHKKNGHIRLDKGETYTLQFNLRPGSLPTLQFKPDVGGTCDAFWSDPNLCPPSSMNAGQYSNPSLHGVKRLDVDVDVEPGGAPLEIHYRLNFDQERSFDPIIIHE
jgi:hypothetical protein